MEELTERRLHLRLDLGPRCGRSSFTLGTWPENPGLTAIVRQRLLPKNSPN
jgi:hypothetical protein